MSPPSASAAARARGVRPPKPRLLHDAREAQRHARDVLSEPDPLIAAHDEARLREALRLTR